jgi:cytochrome c biogenesis protein CcdA
MLRNQLPRLYVFIVLITVAFASITAVALMIGRNIILYIFDLWAWVGVILIGLTGAILIGMYISYRFLAMRSFTPFEKEMMEMRVEVGELKRTAEEIKARLDSLPAAGCEPQGKTDAPATDAAGKGTGAP